MIEIPIGVSQYDEIVITDKSGTLKENAISAVLYSRSLGDGIVGFIKQEDDKFRAIFDTSTLKPSCYNLEIYQTKENDPKTRLKLVKHIKEFATAVEVYATKH